MNWLSQPLSDDSLNDSFQLPKSDDAKSSMKLRSAECAVSFERRLSGSFAEIASLLVDVAALIACYFIPYIPILMR